MGSKLTNANDIELETTLQQLLLDLAGNAVETDVALGVDGSRGHFVCLAELGTNELNCHKTNRIESASKYKYNYRVLFEMERAR